MDMFVFSNCVNHAGAEIALSLNSEETVCGISGVVSSEPQSFCPDFSLAREELQILQDCFHSVALSVSDDPCAPVQRS